MDEKEKQIKGILENLDNKDFTLYFFVLDTKGNPAAGIANIYEHAKVLIDLGYKAVIMHEKDEYYGVGTWLGEAYSSLPHVSIETNLNIKPEDFIIIPEIFSTIMHDVKNFPCKKVVFSQNYHYILELLNPGTSWAHYGFNDVITTSKEQAQYIKKLMPTTKQHVIPVSIPEYFKSTDKKKIPMVTLVTRDQTEAAKIVKSFYLQYPLYKWVTFKELRGIPRKTFAEELGKACLAIWIDDVAGFGTFPVEAMECETPVIGKVPNMVPEWMREETEGNTITIKNNGMWTQNILDIPELVATYMKIWLEDSVPAELLESMETSRGKYTESAQKESIESVYGGLIESRKEEINSMLEKVNNEG